MDNEDRNREREQGQQELTGTGQRDRTTNPPGQTGQDEGQGQDQGQGESQQPMDDRSGGFGSGSKPGGQGGSTDEDLQREGNLGNERNRNQPDRTGQTGSDDDRNT